MGIFRVPSGHRASVRRAREKCPPSNITPIFLPLRESPRARACERPQPHPRQSRLSAIVAKSDVARPIPHPPLPPQTSRPATFRQKGAAIPTIVFCYPPATVLGMRVVRLELQGFKSFKDK